MMGVWNARLLDDSLHKALYGRGKALYQSTHHYKDFGLLGRRLASPICAFHLGISLGSRSREQQPRPLKGPSITTTHLGWDARHWPIPFVNVHRATVAAALAPRSFPEAEHQPVVVILVRCLVPCRRPKGHRTPSSNERAGKYYRSPATHRGPSPAEMRPVCCPNADQQNDQLSP